MRKEKNQVKARNYMTRISRNAFFQISRVIGIENRIIIFNSAFFNKATLRLRGNMNFSAAFKARVLSCGANSFQL